MRLPDALEKVCHQSGGGDPPFVPLFRSLSRSAALPPPLSVSRPSDVGANLRLDGPVGSVGWEALADMILGVQTRFPQQAGGSAGFPLGDLPLQALDRKLRSGIIGNIPRRNKQASTAACQRQGIVG